MIQTDNVVPEYVRLNGAAQFTGLSAALIKKLAADNRIPRVRVGRAVCYPLAGLREFMAARAVQ